MIIRLLKLNLKYGKFKYLCVYNFVSSKDTEETCTIYVWSDNENIKWSNETDNIIWKNFEYFLDNYQTEDQIMRGGRDFTFESVELMDYKLHKTSLKREKSYIVSPKWLKIKEQQ